MSYLFFYRYKALCLVDFAGHSLMIHQRSRIDFILQNPFYRSLHPQKFLAQLRASGADSAVGEVFGRFDSSCIELFGNGGYAVALQILLKNLSYNICRHFIN